MIKFKINDIWAELDRLVMEEARQGTAEGITRRKEAWHAGRASAFKEAIEILDVATRSEEEGAAVPIRKWSEVMEERLPPSTASTATPQLHPRDGSSEAPGAPGTPTPPAA